mmetsp:Transcript_15020/g.37817  ORF Transcript_15020/g.37817 Transcript_15020/m.37817 type:complete len:206 (+) Transcript_15020:193-810(+)
MVLRRSFRRGKCQRSFSVVCVTPQCERLRALPPAHPLARTRHGHAKACQRPACIRRSRRFLRTAARHQPRRLPCRAGPCRSGCHGRFAVDIYIISRYDRRCTGAARTSCQESASPAPTCTVLATISGPRAHFPWSGITRSRGGAPAWHADADGCGKSGTLSASGVRIRSGHVDGGRRGGRTCGPNLPGSESRARATRSAARGWVP